MPVQHEIKSQLAKLLATEDLIVEHKNVQTAQFNVHTRVLILPNWEKASNAVYDMLVGHEVGHALFTPDEWGWEDRVPQNFVNVVEDARIEKLMKRKYEGLAKTFYKGYNELHNEDFFEVDDKDLTTFNLADRINLYCKVGSFLPISFSTIEEPIVNLVKNAETFTDTIAAAEALYNFCKQEQERRSKTQEQEQEAIGEGSIGDSESSGDITIDFPDDNLTPVPNTGSSDSLESGSSSDDIDFGGDSDEPTVETAESFADAIKDLSEKNASRESIYFELPKLDVDNLIIPFQEIYDKVGEDFANQQHEWDQTDRVNIFGFDLYTEVDDKFTEFKQSAQKEVNYLVKEFECKKAADSYARATTSRTGVLDCSKLHTYKHNEDLFRKVTTLSDGKNHGLVFVLDWSGSMQGVMTDTIKQLYNLLWFCKKVNIPFEVYAFTNCYPLSDDGSIRKPSYDKKAGVAFVEETFSLMNLFTSKVNNKILETQMRNIFRLACAFSHDYYCPFNIPIGMNLSGTPLNETLIALHQILPRFKKDNKLQKVQCVILTDGEGYPLKFSKDFQRHWESEPFLGTNYIGPHCVLRDRKLGRTYPFSNLGSWTDITDTLLHNLRDNFPDMNFIGIRILASRDAGQFVRNYTGYTESYEKTMKRWKKEKSFAIKNSGYHTYFGLSSNALNSDTDFEVNEDASKAQIKRAFAKSLKSKKMNKKILGEFIELVV